MKNEMHPEIVLSPGLPVSRAIFRHNAAFILNLGLGAATPYYSTYAIRAALRSNEEPRPECEYGWYCYAPFVMIMNDHVVGSNMLLDHIFEIDENSKYVASRSATVESIFDGVRLKGVLTNTELCVLSFTAHVHVVACLSHEVTRELVDLEVALRGHDLGSVLSDHVRSELELEVSLWRDRAYEGPHVLIHSFRDLKVMTVTEDGISIDPIDLATYRCYSREGESPT
jgi:hypothetical protein